MADLVRVKDPISKHEFTTSREHAEASDLQILDKPAVDERGHGLPAKLHEPRASGKKTPVTDGGSTDTAEEIR